MTQGCIHKISVVKDPREFIQLPTRAEKGHTRGVLAELDIQILLKLWLDLGAWQWLCVISCEGILYILVLGQLNWIFLDNAGSEINDHLTVRFLFLSSIFIMGQGRSNRGVVPAKLSALNVLFKMGVCKIILTFVNHYFNSFSQHLSKQKMFCMFFFYNF